VTDATFILSLRTNPEKAKFLSPVSGALHDQIKWLERYKESTDQLYFIIEHESQSIGTVRIYDPRGESFCWGSWILNENSLAHAAIESALMVYRFGLECLGFKSAHFDVRKENRKVWQFHERFGAVKVGEGKNDYYFEIHEDAIRASLIRYQRYLNSVTVEWE